MRRKGSKGGLDPKSDPASLGNLLLSGGYCTQQDIDAALANADMLMGEYLVLRGIITRDALTVLLQQQRAARGGNGAVMQYAQMAVERSRQVHDRALSFLGRLAVDKLK